jgi:hypothetical protein
MRRGNLWLVTLGLLVPLAASAGTSVGISVNIGDAPPPPVVYVREEPHVVVVPGSSVYVVDDDRCNYDSFRYGVYWYVYNNDYWYRGRTWRGPFRPIEGRYVPRAIMTVPANRWRHHPHGGPPGQMRRRDAAVVDREPGVEVVREKRHGHR